MAGAAKAKSKASIEQIVAGKEPVCPTISPLGKLTLKKPYLCDFNALININGVKLYISSVGDAIRYIKITIKVVFSIDADIVFTAIRTRTRSKIILTEEFYNTEIKPKYSPIEFVSCKYKDPLKISEQNDQLADEIVSTIMKEVQKITNL